MKISMKRPAAFLWICGLLLVMVGCGGLDLGDDGGGNEGGIDETTAFKNAINKKVNSFKEAVERYDVDGMLAFLVENSFELTIAENRNEYTKPYGKLKEELVNDEDKQLHWRDPVPEGHGYVLTMMLHSTIYNKLSSKGAFLTVDFAIWEEADDPQFSQMTDEGNMVCEMVSLQGEWRCRGMTINFRPMDGRTIPKAAQKVKSGSRENRRGFSFGKLDFGE